MSLSCLLGFHKFRCVNVIQGVKVWSCEKCSKVKFKGNRNNIGHSGG